MKKFKFFPVLLMVLNAQKAVLEEVQVSSAETQSTKIEQDQSVQNITSAELEKNSITSTSQLGKFFPSLKIYPQGSDTFPMITIRGITGPDFYSFVLGLYVDGIPQSSNFLIQNLGDVESIRLINGSEGLLYGENAPLGLISIQTKNPLSGNYAKVSASASRLQEELKVNVGWNLIEDKFWGKVNLGYIHDNGFLKDPSTNKMFNSGDSLVLGGTLYYQPITEVLLSAHYSYYYSFHHKDFFLSKSQVDSLKFKSGEQISGYQEYTNGVQNKIFNKDPFSRLNAHNANVKLEYFFGDSTLSVVSAVQKTDTLANSYPGIFVKDNGKDGYYYNTLQVMEELRVHTLWKNNLETLFGAYYKFLDLDNGMDNVPTDEPLGYNGTWMAIEKVNTFALYGNVSVPFGKLTLHTGLRYQFYHNAIDVPLPPTRPAIQPYKDSAVFNAINPRVSLNYDIDSNHQVFLQLSNSSKPGGFSKFPFAGTDTIPYKQEQTISLELGNHSKFLNSALRFDSSLYYLFIYDTQAYVGEGYNKSITNIGNAHSVGIDAEISYQGERWSVFLNGNLGLSQFAKGGKNIGHLVVGQISPYNVSGLRPRFSPIFSLTAGADVLLYQNQNHKFVLGSLLNFTTSYFLDDFNREKDLIQPAYATLDVSLSYTFFKKYELMLFAKNLTNTRYITSVLWDQQGRAYTIGNPLDVGIKLTYTY